MGKIKWQQISIIHPSEYVELRLPLDDFKIPMSENVTNEKSITNAPIIIDLNDTIIENTVGCVIISLL
jgi:hypothetical protein